MLPIGITFCSFRVPADFSRLSFDLLHHRNFCNSICEKKVSTHQSYFACSDRDLSWDKLHLVIGLFSERTIIAVSCINIICWTKTKLAEISQQRYTSRTSSTTNFWNLLFQENAWTKVPDLQQFVCTPHSITSTRVAKIKLCYVDAREKSFVG